MIYIGEGKHIQRNGGVGQFGHCIVELKAGERDKGLLFFNSIKGGVIPKEFIPAIEYGIRDAAERGAIAGYPVTDIEVNLIDGSYHEVDSNVPSFRRAGSLAFQDACKKAPIGILEPYAELVIDLPNEYIGTIVGDLGRRRANVLEISVDYIKAEIPIAESFGYSTDIRSLTQGRANFVLTPIGYREAPNSIKNALVEKHQGIKK